MNGIARPAGKEHNAHVTTARTAEAVLAAVREVIVVADFPEVVVVVSGVGVAGAEECMGNSEVRWLARATPRT